MKRNLPSTIILTLAVLMVVAAAGGRTPAGPAKGRLTAEQVGAEVRSAMDPGADPCQDFYRYSCGGWLDATELPSDQSRWSRSFSVIAEGNRELVRDILEEAAKNPGNDPDRKRIGYFYGACMDEKAVEKAGSKPLRPLLKQIDAVEATESLMKLTGKLHLWNVVAFFAAGTVPDFKNPDLNIGWVTQGGLGLPDRDYYLSEEESKRELLTEYEKHVARILGLLGEDAATARRHAAEVVRFETELAKASRARAEMRQREKLYHKLDLPGLKELAPGLSWDAYLSGLGYPGIVDVNVAVPEFIERLDSLIQETDREVLRAYLRWHVADAFADILSSDFVEANFEFFGAKVRGQEEIRPRWKRCVDATQQALGETIGRVYVDLRFAGPSKDIALEMIGDIETAFENNLPNLAWMDDVTRGRAMEKKAAIRNKIGYPDEWRDYSSMKLTPKSHFDNYVAGVEFESNRQLKKIGKPVDPDEWLMTPQMVNAYYSPLLNEIAFPAGILQPPFFHRDFPAAMNYGGIGGVIGHELTHGFDDQGRKFDPTGKLREWWEPEVTEKFQSRAQCVDDFYSAYEVEPGIHVNGELTLGENIADIGGLKQAYAAYKLWESHHGAPEPLVEGLTNEQLFFVSWGQVWCTVATPEIERLQVTTDPHSPAKFRVQGPVSHNPAFARAFGCEPSDPMVAKNQCEVW